MARLAPLRAALLAAVLALSGLARAAEVPKIQPLPDSGDRQYRDAAVVIGVEAYDQLPQATFAQADAQAWRDWLVRTRGVRESRVTYLDNATNRDMYRYLRKAAWRVRRRGTLWIVFTGHGAITPDGVRTLLPREATVDDLGSQGTPLTDVARHVLRSRRASRVVIILDTAFDGRGRDGLPLVAGTHFQVPEDVGIAQDERIVVWSASATDGPVDAWSASGHGTFTWSALGALRGWADGELDGMADGKVTLAEAHRYVSWTGRQLGQPVQPGLAGDPSHGDLVLAEGSWLESGPTAELMAELSDERRRRRFDDLQTLMRAEASAFWQATLEQAKAGGDEGRAALERFIGAFGERELTLSWTVALPEVREARQLLARYDTALAAAPAEAAAPTDPQPSDSGDGTAEAQPPSPTQEAAQQAALQQVEAAVQAVEEASCDDLVALEPNAMMGQLSPGQLGCLERRVRTDRLQTDKEKASKVLIVNAQAARDQLRWASLVQRHLREISRADPTLVMHYAVYLYTSDPIENGEDAIHWAEVALENKQRWEGDTHIDNVGALYRIRAEAAYKMWIAADREYRANPNEDTEWQSEEYRGLTKDYAREWLDFLRAAGRDIDKALQICTSAAGTADFCRGR